ncbi:hypothetical protein EJB05_42013, partial [Eragrostis curvula]
MSPSRSRSLLHLPLLFGRRRRRRGDNSSKSSSNGMGCAQGKPSRGSPARSDGPRGLDRLMRDNAYRPASTGAASRLSDPYPVAERQRPLAAGKEEPAHARRSAAGSTGAERKATPGDDDETAAHQQLTPTSTPPLPPRREDELVDGWPTWLLDNVPREALEGIVPKSADAYDKIEKAPTSSLEWPSKQASLNKLMTMARVNAWVQVGQGTYSNVYKARERGTGRIVALKKVRFDTSESESVRFMAREMRILQRLDHPNVIRLEGIATSRMHRSIYLVFDFMYSDLTRIIARPEQRLTQPQVEQLFKIFSLCGSPPDDYWRKMKLSATFRPPKAYKPTMAERCRDMPPSALSLLTTLLALDPAARGTAAQALQSDFFSTPPLPCDIASLPVVYKEEVVDPSTSHDGRKPKLRQRSHRRKDGRPKAEEQPAEEPKINSGSTDHEVDRVTDSAKSGRESESAAVAIASSSSVQESQEDTIVNASSSTAPKQFSVSPVQLLPQPQEASPATTQDQPPQRASSHHHSGSDEDLVGHQPLLSLDNDQVDGPSGSGSVIVLDRSPEIRPASMTDYEAAVAALRGSGELPSKQYILVDHV